jgi:truncated hemoglobin YjbI
MLYDDMGRAAGCRALAAAFYAWVERDPVLRPFFPSTFRCAIEEFSAFLVQFLGGEAEDAQKRNWLSLRESHGRFAIGERERAAWLRAMHATLQDESVAPDAGVRRELREFFESSSAYIVSSENVGAPQASETAALWHEQIALDEVVASIRLRDAARSVELLEGAALRWKFARCPEVHAWVLALAATATSPDLRAYAIGRIREQPSLIHERYRRGRTLLHDASGAGDADLAELLLDLGAGQANTTGEARTPLYCVANECLTSAAGRVVRLLLARSAAQVNATHGSKRCTALHMAARRGNIGTIAALLDGGADTEARDSAGETPLRRAVNCNRMEAAKLLLERGADAHSRDNRGRRPLEAARTEAMKRIFV